MLLSSCFSIFWALIFFFISCNVFNIASLNHGKGGKHNSLKAGSLLLMLFLMLFTKTHAENCTKGEAADLPS